MYGIAVLFLVLGVLLQITGAIGNFLSPQNMLNIVDAVALVGIVAVGMAFVTYSGNFADMSVPDDDGLHGLHLHRAPALRFRPRRARRPGSRRSLIGLLNGFVVGKFKANPIIWTLAVNYVTMGIIRLVWVNKQIYPDMRGSGQSAVALFDEHLPLALLQPDRPARSSSSLVMVVVGQFVLTRTILRRRSSSSPDPLCEPPSSPALPWSGHHACLSSLPPSPRRLPAWR